MKKWRKSFEIEELTPEKRLERIVELLARGAVRMEVEKVNQKKVEAADIKNLASKPEEPVVYGEGRMPFGQKLTERGRVIDAVELKWIRRIKQLVGQGLSMEKIAKRLNAEDHETRRQGKWCGSTVWRLLKRENTKGIAE
jgi:hypothetical protein